MPPADQPLMMGRFRQETVSRENLKPVTVVKRLRKPKQTPASGVQVICEKEIPLAAAQRQT